MDRFDADRAPSLAERRIAEAMARGEFDDLPGSGRPLDLSDAGDPDWWLKRYLRREQIDLSLTLPPSIRLRREAETFPESLTDLPTEDAVRAVLADYNRRVAEEILRVRRTGEPPVWPRRVDVEDLVAAWRQLTGRGPAG